MPANGPYRSARGSERLPCFPCSCCGSDNVEYLQPVLHGGQPWGVFQQLNTPSLYRDARGPERLPDFYLWPTHAKLPPTAERQWPAGSTALALVVAAMALDWPGNHGGECQRDALALVEEELTFCAVKLSLQRRKR